MDKKITNIIKNIFLHEIYGHDNGGVNGLGFSPKMTAILNNIAQFKGRSLYYKILHSKGDRIIQEIEKLSSFDAGNHFRIRIERNVHSSFFLRVLSDWADHGNKHLFYMHVNANKEHLYNDYIMVQSFEMWINNISSRIEKRLKYPYASINGYTFYNIVTGEYKFVVYYIRVICNDYQNINQDKKMAALFPEFQLKNLGGDLGIVTYTYKSENENEKSCGSSVDYIKDIIGRFVSFGEDELKKQLNK